MGGMGVRSMEQQCRAQREEFCQGSWYLGLGGGVASDKNYSCHSLPLGGP